MFEIVINDQIQLCFLFPNDAEEAFEVIDRNRAFLDPYIRIREKKTVADSREDLLKRLQAFAKAQAWNFGIRYEGKLIGGVILMIRQGIHKFGEIGYWIEEAYARQGIMSQVVKTMIDFAFLHTSLHKLAIKCSPDNIPSNAIAKKFGFHLDALHRQAWWHYDHFQDANFYSLLRDEWQAPEGPLHFGYALGDGVYLKLVEMNQDQAIFQTVDQNREHLRQWLPWVDSNETVQETRSFIQAALGEIADNRGLSVGIWDQEQLVGMISIHPWDELNLEGEIGYWLSKSHTGRGIMTRAVKRVVDFAFEQIQLNRIIIRCAVGNQASCAIPKRLGFVHEGQHRKSEFLQGQYHDSNIFSMLRKEWNQE